MLRIRDVYPDLVSRIQFFPTRTKVPGSRVDKIPDLDLHQRILVFLTQKLVVSSPNMIRDVHPGSWDVDFLIIIIFYHPGSSGKKNTGSRIRIRNTDMMYHFLRA
jgi:hypothetical protein